MPELTLIRHAPTASNEQGIFMGSVDLPIAEQYYEPASALGAQLASIRFTRHYSSPLLRAWQTAQCIFPDAEIVHDSRLSERALGEWGGHSKEAIRNEFPDAFYASGTMNPIFTPPGGEPLDSVVERVRSFLSDIFSLPNDERVVAVTHNGILRVMRCLLEKRPFEEIFISMEPHLQPRTYDLGSLSCSPGN